MINRHMKDNVVFVRDGNETAAVVYVQGRTIFAKLGVDVHKGDRVRWEGFAEEHVVTKSELHRAPPGRGRGDLNHTEIKIVPLHELEQGKKERAPAVTQNFHGVGPVGAIAGRDVNGPVVGVHNETHVTAIQLLETLQAAIEKDETIPEKERAGILSTLKGLVVNPYVQALGTTAIGEMVKGWFAR